MPKTNTDYLQINSNSMSNFLKQKMSQDSSFTDQVYSGSNLSILIDGFSYMYENLMFYLNHSAAESLFSDASLYENMNRIVRSLGYNPLGHRSSKASLVIVNKDQQNTAGIFGDDLTKKLLPTYTTINTGKKDSLGKTIYYSLLNDVQVDNLNSAVAQNPTKIQSINGRWKTYSTTFFSVGIPNEVFILSAIDLTTEFVDHDNIVLYIKTYNGTSYEYVKYTPIPNGMTFGNTSFITSPESRIFEFRINENKTYEIMFGDGVHGQQLKESDEIYVVYLESNGTEGQIGYEVINEDSTISFGIEGINMDTFFKFLGETQTSYYDKYLTEAEVAQIYFTNILTSSPFNEMESVDSIRANAPFWFKTGGNLLTENDFRENMLLSYGNLIYDVNVQNNITYINTFMKWLYDYNRLNVNIRAYGYKYSTACDFNNVYIWLRQKYDFDRERVYLELQNQKVLTSEVVLMNALDTVFVPMFDYQYNDLTTDEPKTVLYSQATPDVMIFPSKTTELLVEQIDPDVTNWIEIIKDRNATASSERLKTTVAQEIRDFFSPTTNKIGNQIDMTDLYNKLININGVKQVRMAFLPTGYPTSSTRYYNGISFARLTPALLVGRDFQLVQGSTTLQPFMFPVLGQSSKLESRIKVLVDANNQNNISY